MLLQGSPVTPGWCLRLARCSRACRPELHSGPGGRRCRACNAAHKSTTTWRYGETLLTAPAGGWIGEPWRAHLTGFIARELCIMLVGAVGLGRGDAN